MHQGSIHFKPTMSVWKEVIKEGIFLGKRTIKKKKLNEDSCLAYEQVIPNKR